MDQGFRRPQVPVPSPLVGYPQYTSTPLPVHIPETLPSSRIVGDSQANIYGHSDSRYSRNPAHQDAVNVAPSMYQQVPYIQQPLVQAPRGPAEHPGQGPTPIHGSLLQTQAQQLNDYLQSGLHSIPKPLRVTPKYSVPAAASRKTPPIMSNRNHLLNKDEVLKILKTVDTYNSPEDFSYAPGGAVYLFKPESVLHSEDWRYAGHIFRSGGGSRVLRPKADPSVTLTHQVDCIITPDKKKYGDTGFKRHSWQWDGRPHHVLIQFLGV